jgi:dTDP-4-amino-4,6-dideoxygalactose transaminase
MELMRSAGVQTSIHFRPIDTFTIYQEAGLGPCEYLRYTHQIGERALTLPLYPSMGNDEVDFVCETLGAALRVA